MGQRQLKKRDQNPWKEKDQEQDLSPNILIL